MDLKGEGNQFTAEVKRSSVVLCQLSAVGALSDEAAVRRALADKARWWIQEFLSRNG